MLINFLPLSRGGGGLLEGGLHRGFTVFLVLEKGDE